MTSEKSNNKVTIALIALVAAAVAGFLIFVPYALTAEAQIRNAAVLLPVLFCLTVSRQYVSGMAAVVIRMVIISISVVLIMRYLVWRGTYTLPYHLGPTAMTCGVLLFATECYCFIVGLLNYLANMRPRERTSIPLPADVAAWPTVDIYIPTYNEAPDIVRPTVIAATQMRYPSDKLRVYLLDDGGTTQKCHDPDPEKAAAARSRAIEIKAIAEQFGAHYLTRDRNEHAKAGNINHALGSTEGELLAIFDCDHVPTSDFIEKTVGFFLEDRKLFLVQTPHHFINADPLERNLSILEKSPAENDLFFAATLPGLDRWGSAFFCGSAALLRRSALDDIGGIAQETITEDAETTVMALSHGYKTAYYNQPMISGLQAESFSGFILQRARWGQGMLQILMLKNPWTLPGLSVMQRLMYTNFSLFWGFPVSRLIMLLAPPVALFFSVPLANTSVTDLVIFVLPALLGSFMTSQYLYGHVRWPFISLLYEVVQSTHLIKGIYQVFRHPRSPTFAVTPKGEILHENFISSLSRPFYLLLFISLAAIINGAIRYAHEPLNQSAILTISAWAFFDLLCLLCALGVTFERRQRRTEPRASVEEPVLLRVSAEMTLHGTAIDASTSGARIILKCNQTQLSLLQKQEQLHIQFPARGFNLDCSIQTAKFESAGHASIGLAYQFQSIEDERAAVAIAFGSSAQLLKNREASHHRKSLARSLVSFLGYAIRGLSHLSFLAVLVFKRKIEPYQWPTPLKEKE
jgi:cellulose synthase (UDP-forming)